MPGPAFATGDTVSLHPVEEEDYEFVQRGRNDPSTRVPLTDTTIRTRDDVAEMFEDREYHFLACVDGDPVGVVAFAYVQEDSGFGSLMYWVAPEHRGEGYVTEATSLFLDYAFGECGFHRVGARVLVTNEASTAALESLGFEREGRLRDTCRLDGEWVDSYQYSLLAPEWLE
ncbi:GNAT family N-acetyltransferase [Halostella litorea]|uniref:GNAT family N-acetyltransferase n=1 Tax=Halostella litorea TaxID=2528831 RepID=UPI001091F3FE|nr:GNAT family protein [Halostella litorea]